MTWRPPPTTATVPRGAPICARTFPVVVFQPRHDPSVDAAQPCPLGGLVARPSIRRRRRMPLLPRCFRLQRGDGAAPPVAVVCPICGCADGDLRQRDDGVPRRDGRGTDRAVRSRRSSKTAHPRAPGRWRCGNPRCGPDLTGENGAPVRRSAGAEAARVMADLVAEGAQTLTFVRSRRAAELTALGCTGPTGRHRPGALPDGGVVSGRLSRRGPHARWSAPWPRAGCAVWPPQMPWS